MNEAAAQVAREDAEKGMWTILGELAANASLILNDDYPERHRAAIFASAGPYAALQRCLSDWIRQLGKPLVLLIDEVYSLVGDTLISLLRQLRAGYPHRPRAFPQGLVMVVPAQLPR